MNIVLDRVTVRFQDRTVLTDLSVALTERRIGVVGDNGSGKSTFARLINGLLIPDAGTVTVDGINTKTDGKNVRRRVGFLFQNPDNQIVMPTVAEDIALGLKPLGLDKQAAEQKVSKTLAQFRLSDFADRSAHVLSGGEKQLVALAGVMVTEPDIVVCDEPTTLLDRRNAARVMDIIAALPCSVITITHHVEQLTDYDRVLVLSGGMIACDAKPGEAVSFYLKALP